MLKNKSGLYFAVSVLIILFLLEVFFFIGILHYNLMHSDVLSYWQESMSWRTPFYEHPPMYAWIIALVRTITFNTINPLALMISINLLTFAISVICVYEFVYHAGINQTFAIFSAFLFGLWPFVGLTFTVMPIADSPAFAFTLGGLVALQKSRRPLAMFLFALASLTHKGVWPIIGLIVLADFYVRHEYFSRRNLAYLGILLFPLVTLWIAGSFYHHSIFWLVQPSIKVNTTFGGGYPILDGLIGTFQKGGTVGIVKGLTVLFFILLSIATLVASVKVKFTNNIYCIAISLAVLIMFLFSSAQNVWGPVRYSTFLVIPVVFTVYTFVKEKHFKLNAVLWSSILFLGLYISQLAYAWYIKFLHIDNI